MNPSTLLGALKRKKRQQVVLADSNPCGFKLIDKSKAQDHHYSSVDFVGVFSKSATLKVIKDEIKFQCEVEKINSERIL